MVLVVVLGYAWLAVGFSPSHGDPVRGSAAPDSLLQVAHALLGTPYLPGGKKPGGFDCSGYTRYTYQQLGIRLNASAAAQFEQGRAVPSDSLQPGDLVFFKNSRGYIFHVGIYEGIDDEEKIFVHASSSRGVRRDRLNAPYFRQRWAGARRIFSE